MARGVLGAEEAGFGVMMCLIQRRRRLEPPLHGGKLDWLGGILPTNQTFVSDVVLINLPSQKFTAKDNKQQILKSTLACRIERKTANEVHALY